VQDSKILYALKDHVCFIRMIGDIRHTLSSGFDAVIKQVIREGKISEFIIDLCEAKYIDSTNLGMLARIAGYSAEKSDVKPTLLSCNQDITNVLLNMGFDGYFTISTTREETAEELQEPPTMDDSRDEKSRIILEAHEALMDMNENNREMFSDVVEVLTKRAGRLELGDTAF
jgi:anti-anti-sigma factor